MRWSLAYCSFKAEMLKHSVDCTVDCLFCNIKLHVLWRMKTGQFVCVCSALSPLSIGVVAMPVVFLLLSCKKQNSLSFCLQSKQWGQGDVHNRAHLVMICYLLWQREPTHLIWQRCWKSGIQSIPWTTPVIKDHLNSCKKDRNWKIKCAVKYCSNISVQSLNLL